MADDAVLDLDALDNEAGRKPFPFKHGGEDYTLPPTLDLRVAIALDEGNITEACRLLLGEQWDRILASPAVLDSAKFQALMNAYMAHLGTTMGESRASRRSSGSTARPSKRTSNASTVVR